MLVLVEGINPEPWRSPSLGIKKVGRRSVPVSFKDENLRSYQQAIHELVEEALAEQGISTPVYGPKVELTATFAFWRQLDRYQVEGDRTRVRARPDLTNMIKAAEDALQGLLYQNDRAIRFTSAGLVEVGADVEPALLVGIEPLDGFIGPAFESVRRAMINGNGMKATSGAVWVQGDRKCSPTRSASAGSS